MTRSKTIECFRDRISQAKRFRLTKSELEGLIVGFIEMLKATHTESDIKRLCEAEIQLLEEGYPQSTLASDYLPKYRQAIAQAITCGELSLTSDNSHRYVHHQRLTGKADERLEHWALTYLKYSPTIYEALDQRQAQINRSHQLSLKGIVVDHYLKTLEKMLHAQGKFVDRQLAVAIAGLTGRRFAEVIAKGSFRLTEHAYLLHFEGHQKFERTGYDIITLLPAEIVLDHIQKLREFPEVQAIATLTEEALPEALNKFDVQVNRVCDHWLGQTGIVPLLEGKKQVSVHNLRSLWGAIAAYFFCPPHHHEYAFMQHYLGHVLQSAATSHYFRFQLLDPEGKVLREQGLKLAEVGELPLLMEMPSTTLSPEQTMTSSQHPSTPKVNEADAHPSQDPHAEAIAQPPLPQFLQTQLETEFNQMRESLHGELQTQIQALKQSMATTLEELRHQSNARAWAWLIQRVDDLETENHTLKQERDTLVTHTQEAQAVLEEVQRLRSENQALSAQLNHAQTKLAGFRRLLDGEPTQEQLPQLDAMVPQPPLTPTAPPQPLETSQQAPLIKSPKRGRKPGTALQRAERIFYALQDWNRQHPYDTFALTPGLLETVFRVNRKAAKLFCHQFQPEIAEHHALIGVLNPLSHNRYKDVQNLKRFIDTLIV